MLEDTINSEIEKNDPRATSHYIIWEGKYGLEVDKIYIRWFITEGSYEFECYNLDIVRDYTFP